MAGGVVVRRQAVVGCERVEIRRLTAADNRSVLVVLEDDPPDVAARDPRSRGGWARRRQQGLWPTWRTRWRRRGRGDGHEGTGGLGDPWRSRRIGSLWLA